MLAIARSAHLTEDDDEPFDLEVALAERDDLRAALDWFAASDVERGLELMIALETFWNAHAPNEGLQRSSDFFARAGSLDPWTRARGLRVYGNTASLSGDDATAKSCWEASLDAFRRLESDRGAAGILHRLALEPLRLADYEQARRLVDESQSLGEGRFRLIETVNLHIYAELAKADGRVEEAFALELRSAEMARDMQWFWWESGRRDVLIRLGLCLDRVDDAERHGCRAFEIERQQENDMWAVHTLSGLAQVALARGELRRAGILWGAAEAGAERFPVLGFPGRNTGGDERRGALVTERNPEFLRAFDDGRLLDLWDAGAMALGELELPQTEP